MSKTGKIEVMEPGHARWAEFAAKLGPRAWGCKSERDCPQATAVLREMGFSDSVIRKSLARLRSMGGGCDCEIMLNVVCAEGN